MNLRLESRFTLQWSKQCMTIAWRIQSIVAYESCLDAIFTISHHGVLLLEPGHSPECPEDHLEQPLLDLPVALSHHGLLSSKLEQALRISGSPSKMLVDCQRTTCLWSYKDISKAKFTGGHITYMNVVSPSISP